MTAKNNIYAPRCITQNFYCKPNPTLIQYAFVIIIFIIEGIVFFCANVSNFFLSFYLEQFMIALDRMKILRLSKTLL